MQLSFGFGPGEGLDATGSRASKLLAVLAAARRTGFYGPQMAQWASGNPEEHLGQLTPTGVHIYLQNREQFRNPKAAGGKTRAAERRSAEAIRGSLEELLRLAARVAAGETTAPAAARRVTIRTALGERLAAERARDCLWRAFELPVFEELVGSEGETLAAECEAHSGFHLEDASAIFEAFYGELVVTSLKALRYPILRLRTGWVGAIERGLCPCGERVARFAPVALTAAPPAPARKPPATARAARRAADPAAAAV
jgi:hypothetical protein